MLVRNLMTLEDRQRPPAPNLNIRSAGQVNVGQRTNVAGLQVNPKAS